jgi:Domain of unknown function (DUF4136)
MGGNGGIAHPLMLSGTPIAAEMASGGKSYMKRRTAKLSGVALLTVAAVALALSSCATLQVGSDYDRHVDFSKYRTFSLMQRQHRETHNPLVVQRTEDDITQALISKGYQHASDPGTADFAVDFTIGSRERTDINSYPQPYAAGGWAGWGWGPGWWGGPYWGNTIDVRQVREGTLSIDAFDAQTHRPIWHGWAQKDLSRGDIEQSEQPIREAVQAVLAKFPPTR